METMLAIGLWYTGGQSLYRWAEAIHSLEMAGWDLQPAPSQASACQSKSTSILHGIETKPKVS